MTRDELALVLDDEELRFPVRWHAPSRLVLFYIDQVDGAVTEAALASPEAGRDIRRGIARAKRARAKDAGEAAAVLRFWEQAAHLCKHGNLTPLAWCFLYVRFRLPDTGPVLLEDEGLTEDEGAMQWGESPVPAARVNGSPEVSRG